MAPPGGTANGRAAASLSALHSGLAVARQAAARKQGGQLPGLQLQRLLLWGFFGTSALLLFVFAPRPPARIIGGGGGSGRPLAASVASMLEPRPAIPYRYWVAADLLLSPPLGEDAAACLSALADALAALPQMVLLRVEFAADSPASAGPCTGSGAGDGASSNSTDCVTAAQQLCLQEWITPFRNSLWFVPSLLCHTHGGGAAEAEGLAYCMARQDVPEATRAKVLRCAGSARTAQLLTASAARAAALGGPAAAGSTLFIDGKRACVWSAGAVSDCPGGGAPAALAKAVCAAFRAKGAPQAGECDARAAALPSAGDGTRR